MNKNKLVAIALGLFFLLIFAFTPQTKHEGAPAFQRLYDKDIQTISLNFYPGTLRMINLSADSSYYALIKPLKRATYLQFDQAALPEPVGQFSNNFLKTLQDEEHFEELMTLRNEDGLVHIMENENTSTYILSISNSDSWRVIQVIGHLDPKNIQGLFNMYEEGDFISLDKLLEIGGKKSKRNKAHKPEKKEEHE